MCFNNDDLEHASLRKVLVLFEPLKHTALSTTAMDNVIPFPHAKGAICGTNTSITLQGGSDYSNNEKRNTLQSHLIR